MTVLLKHFLLWYLADTASLQSFFGAYQSCIFFEVKLIFRSLIQHSFKENYLDMYR